MNNPEIANIQLICVITDFGNGSKIIHTAKQYGINGGTVLLAKGTAGNRILEFLCLCDVRKEIVLMVTDEKTACHALEKLNGIFKFERPHHGIAFTVPVCGLLGISNYKNCGIIKERGVEGAMYNVITVIVDKGKSELVLDAAVKAGSKGGTVINGRGAGIHETNKLFSMEIEPEKEIVIILSETHLTEGIASSINKELKIDKPGHGIIYVQNVNKTYGIYK